MTYLEAIIQHFGLPVGRTYPHMGAPCGSVALMIQLSAEDHGAIGRLMCDDVMQVAVSGKVETNDIVRRVDVDELGFPIQGQRGVQHVEVPDEDPVGVLPPHVFLYKNMCTELQRVAPLGIDDTNGQYAVAIDDLSDEQRAIPHIMNQLARMAREAKEVRRPPVPYDHVWMFVRQRDASRYAGLDLVYDQGDVAMPWEALTEHEQRGVQPIPATLPENNT